MPLIAQGRFFDGQSARAHPVTLRLDHSLGIEGLEIRRDWSLFDLRAAESPAPLTRVGPAGSRERVEFDDAALATALTERCPDLRLTEEGGGGILRLMLWSIAAGLSVLLIAVFGVPMLAGMIAPLVPVSIERRLGGAVDGQVALLLGSPPVCDGKAGRDVLDRLVERLVEGADLPERPGVIVRQHDMANAFALPGARIVVLSDILSKANSPDEFSAILAHEIGHLARRDPIRAVIAAGGTSFLLSLILGDLTGSTILVTVGQAAIAAGYSRDAERAADAYAVATIDRAGGDPTALASILERIDKEPEDKGSASSFLRSHPFTKERAATIRAWAGDKGRGRRMLSDADWQVLRAICPSGLKQPAREQGKSG